MDDLRCNSLKCRKSLSLEGSAVVTTCSHIFCIQCATSLFSQPQICPACETSLPEPDDAVQTNLSPPDAYKTSVLAGLSPILVLDIASRALNFYTYQVQQESAFQALVTKNAQERIAVLESQCQNIIREATSEITLLKDRVTVSERDLELERRKVRDLQETHKGNAKAYNKLKAQLDKAQQRALLAPGTNNLTGNFVSAAANQHIPSSSTPFHPTTMSRPTSVIQQNDNQSNQLNSHNRALQGWANTYSGGGGNSSQPISNQPGHSTTRPRRSLQDQNVLPSPSTSQQQQPQQQQFQLPRPVAATPLSNTIPIHSHSQSKNLNSNFGQGYFGGAGNGSGSGGGIIPMTTSNSRKNSTREFMNPTTSEGSGGSGGGNSSRQTGAGVLKYLGQQNRSKVSGGFRPAAGTY